MNPVLLWCHFSYEEETRQLRPEKCQAYGDFLELDDMIERGEIEGELVLFALLLLRPCSNYLCHLFDGGYDFGVTKSERWRNGRRVL